MTGNKVLVAGLFGAAVALSAPAAFAQAQADRGWYGGFSIGQSKADCDTSGTGLSCDDSDTAWKIFGGYQINRTWGVELGYTDLGEISATGGGVNINVESTAWDLVGVGTFPINNQFSVYGKLGFYRAETEVSSNVAGGSGDKNTTDFTFGVGVRYDFTRNVGLRAEWQRYSGVEAPNTTVTAGDSDIDVLSVAVIWRF